MHTFFVNFIKYIKVVLSLETFFLTLSLFKNKLRSAFSMQEAVQVHVGGMNPNESSESNNFYVHFC